MLLFMLVCRRINIESFYTTRYSRYDGFTNSTENIQCLRFFTFNSKILFFCWTSTVSDPIFSAQWNKNVLLRIKINIFTQFMRIGHLKPTQWSWYTLLHSKITLYWQMIFAILTQLSDWYVKPTHTKLRCFFLSNRNDFQPSFDEKKNFFFVKIVFC